MTLQIPTLAPARPTVCVKCPRERSRNVDGKKTALCRPIAGIGAALLVSSFAVALTVTTASPARAEPEPQHVIGEDCHGFEVGMRALDPSGQDIICDTDGYPLQNYHWHLYIGQVPHHCSMGICGNE
jgi:hypothetical protein